MEEERWVTEEQLADILKSPENARIIIAAGDLGEPRKSRYASLAAQDKGTEHRLTDELWRKARGKRTEAGVEASCELKAEEYKQIADSINEAKLNEKPTVKTAENHTG